MQVKWAFDLYHTWWMEGGKLANEPPFKVHKDLVHSDVIVSTTVLELLSEEKKSQDRQSSHCKAVMSSLRKILRLCSLTHKQYNTRAEELPEIENQRLRNSWVVLQQRKRVPQVWDMMLDEIIPQSYVHKWVQDLICPSCHCSWQLLSQIHN